MQKRYQKFALLLLCCMLCFLLSSCNHAEAPEKENEEFNSFLDKSFQTLVARDGLTLHNILIHPEEYAINRSACTKLPDLSEKGMADFLRSLRSIEKELDSYDVKTLSSRQKEVAILLKDNLRGAIEEEEKYPYYRSYLSGSGSFTNIRTSFVEYTFREEDDLKNYQQLLAQLPEYMNQMIAYEVRRQQAGLLPSKTALNQTLSSLKEFLDIDPDKNIYISSYAEKIEKADFLTDSQKKEYLAKNNTLVKKTILPAYKKTLETLTSRLKGSTKMESLLSYPNGSDYYCHLMRYSVGTELSPEEAITLLTNSLENVKKELAALREANPDIETDASCALPLEMDSQKIMEKLQKDSLIEFPSIGEVPYTLEDATLSLIGTNSLAYYVIPPYDAKDENRIALSGLSSIELDFFPTLAHEGYPGHLYQETYARQHMFHPIQTLLGVKGYEEGWGKYAEFYSYDFMEFANIPEDAVAALQEYLRAQKKYNLYLSCLSDLQVNYLGYDKKQVEKSLEDYGYDIYVADDLYDYVHSHAFQYLYYGLGYLEFEKMLTKAQGQDNFSMLQFHEDVLRYGSCPFYLLSSFQEEDNGQKSAK